MLEPTYAIKSYVSSFSRPAQKTSALHEILHLGDTAPIGAILEIKIVASRETSISSPTCDTTCAAPNGIPNGTRARNPDVHLVVRFPRFLLGQQMSEVLIVSFRAMKTPYTNKTSLETWEAQSRG